MFLKIKIIVNKVSTIAGWLCHHYSDATVPDRKKYSLLRDKYVCEDSRISYLRLKSLNKHSEWGNIKECNKYRCAILNIHGQGWQLMINP